VRFWTLLLNHEPGQINRYIESVLTLFDRVKIVRCRRKDLPHALLLQFDVELVQDRSRNGPPMETLAAGVAYSGWVRDGCRSRIYSSLNDDALVVDPSTQPLIGEFSYARADERGARVATDHYATHPVYYHRGMRGQWIVSNDLRLVLSSRDVPAQIDRASCSRFLSHTIMLDENELANGATFFTHVRKLERDSVLCIDADGSRHRIIPREPCVTPKRSPFVANERHECAEAFKAAFDECVRDRLNAGAGAILLSGGIDSSTVLGACISSGSKTPFAVSVAFKDPDLVMSHDEKLLAALFGTRSVPHEILYADAALRFPMLDDAAPFVDGPDSAANPLVKEACAAALQRRGISLVMTGEGGDVVLGEAMHELIVDGIREKEGLVGVHRYLTSRLGMRCRSAAYWRKLLESALPFWGHRALLREARKTHRLPSPAFLKPAVADAAMDIADRPCRDAPRFAYIGHRYMHGMLYPRASYFDTLNVQCVNSHPFLDPRMISFALTCPPHFHHDYLNVDRANPYASAKMLARIAYRHELPAAVLQKTHKTSYTLMARRMFHNSATALYALTEEPMTVSEWGLVDQTAFRRELMAYIVAMEDPNANPGLRYHYIRGVCDLETWLRRFSCPRAHLDAQLKMRPLRRLV
jgi:asparagine synthase (glutamine-hydrolysing)